MYRSTAIFKMKQIIDSIIALKSADAMTAALIGCAERSRAEGDAEKRRGFSLWGYVGEDCMKPALMGVYFNCGYKVASDSHILVAMKEDYPAELEEHIVYVGGVYSTEMRYPAWRQVCEFNPDSPVIEMDRDRLRKIWKEVAAYKEDIPASVDIGGIFIRRELFLKAMTFINAHKGCSIEVQFTERTPWKIRCGDDYCVAMPEVIVDKDKVRIFEY